jgi:hypothetical protein
VKRRDGNANFDHGRFFADPVKTAERGPKNMMRVVEAQIEAQKELVATAERHQTKEKHYKLRDTYPAVIAVCRLEKVYRFVVMILIRGFIR